MKFVVDDCMDAVLGDIQLGGNVMLCSLSICHNDVINLGKVSCVETLTGLLGQGSSSRLSLPRLNSAAYFFTVLYDGAFSPSVTTMFVL